MSTPWSQISDILGGTLHNQRFTPNESRPLLQQIEGSGIAPLPHYGFIAVQGPDSQTFLQGQTTADLRLVTPQQSALGAYCNVKGRMVSNFRLLGSGEQDFYLRLRHDLVEGTLTTLSKYIVFSKAEMSDQSDHQLAFGLFGDAAKPALEEAFGSLNTGHHSATPIPGGAVIQCDHDGQQFELWSDFDHAANHWNALAQQLPSCSTEAWELLQIRAGEAEITLSTSDEIIPQMANYELIGGVNFKKGCYTGQEVVARMQYRGKTKRRLYRIGAKSEPVHPGDLVIQSDNSQNVGIIVNSVSINDTQIEALAVIATQAAQTGGLSLANQSPIELRTLPYSVEID